MGAYDWQLVRRQGIERGVEDVDEFHLQDEDDGELRPDPLPEVKRVELGPGETL